MQVSNFLNTVPVKFQTSFLPSIGILLMAKGARNSFSLPCGINSCPFSFAWFVAIFDTVLDDDIPNEIGKPVSFIIFCVKLVACW